MPGTAPGCVPVIEKERCLSQPLRGVLWGYYWVDYLNCCDMWILVEWFVFVTLGVCKIVIDLGVRRLMLDDDDNGSDFICLSWCVYSSSLFPSVLDYVFLLYEPHLH